MHSSGALSRAATTHEALRATRAPGSKRASSRARVMYLRLGHHTRTHRAPVQVSPRAPARTAPGEPSVSSAYASQPPVAQLFRPQPNASRSSACSHVANDPGCYVALGHTQESARILSSSSRAPQHGAQRLRGKSPLAEVLANPSLELTRSGSRGLAATGHVWHCPSAAKPQLPTRAAQLQR